MHHTSAMRQLRTARFAAVYEQWACRQITQAHAASLLGVSDRTFRRYVARYRKLGWKGLEDRRSTSARRAPREEVAALRRLYGERYSGWSVREFFEVYRDEHEGGRSYTWVKSRLHEVGLVIPRRTTRSIPETGSRQPAEGLLVHQASCTNEWLPTRIWELVVIVDDASRRVHSGLFVEREVIECRLRTVHETIVTNGLFEAIQVDRALQNHHDCRKTGQFARAMRRLCIDVIPSCPPKARSAYKHMFRILSLCLPQQLADGGIVSIREANGFLRSYWEKLNRFFAIEPQQCTSAFDPVLPSFDAELVEILCLARDSPLPTKKAIGL